MLAATTFKNGNMVSSGSRCVWPSASESRDSHRTGNPGGKKKPKPYKVADVELSSPKTDPQGMYTGIPADPDDEPVQDADDL